MIFSNILAFIGWRGVGGSSSSSASHVVSMSFSRVEVFAIVVSRRKMIPSPDSSWRWGILSSLVVFLGHRVFSGVWVNVWRTVFYLP